VAQHWKDGTPVQTIVKQPGKPLPDVMELNNAIPQEEWEDGLDGEPRPPWVKQHVAYLINPVDASTPWIRPRPRSAWPCRKTRTAAA